MSPRDPEQALRQGAAAERALGLDLGDELAREALKAQLFGAQQPLRHIGRYRVRAAIASGGMGTVLEARDDALGRTVAIKVVRADVLGSGAKARDRLIREARAMAALSHPNVVQVYDTGQLGDDVFIAMEYIQGETLRTWLSRIGSERGSAAHWKRCLAHFIAVGAGLAAAHDIGLVHRDFKPNNVLIGDDGRARLTDFGLVHSVVATSPEAVSQPAGATPPSAELETRDGVLSGTPAYMAPEQLAGRTADARSDLFSFCVALYEALYGVRPYMGANVEDLRRAMLAGEIDRGAGAPVPGWLRAVLLRGLAVDPTARPPIRALIAALEHDPDALRERRIRGLAWGAATFAALVALALMGRWAWEAWAQRQTERAAEERIARIEAAVAGLRARGEDARAEALLEEELGDADLAGTEALEQAWLRAGARRAAQPVDPAVRARDAASLDAYARAWTLARTEEVRAAALLGIAAELREQGRFQDLGRLLTRLEQEHPAQFRAPAQRQMRLETALALRDVETAAALAEGTPAVSTLEALRKGSPTAYQGEAGISGSAVTLGLGGPPAQLVTHRVAHTWRVDVRATLPDGEVWSSQPMVWSLMYPARSTRGATPFLAARESNPDGGCVLLRIDPTGAPETVARWSEAGVPLAAAAVDLDGDGADEVYVGVGQGSRDIFQIAADSAGRWSVRAVGEDVTLGSDVQALLPADLDGDGAPELIVGLGPWSAYDVRVVALDPATTRLRTRARLKLGSVSALALVERETMGKLLAVGKTDTYPNTKVFPAGRPFGEPAGIYLLRLVGDALVQVDRLPTLQPRVRVLEVADVNGDGRDDLVEDDFTTLTVHVQDESGAFSPLRIGGATLHAVLQADADPASELAVNLAGWAPGGRVVHNQLWVLGAGTQTPPVWAPERWTPPADSPSDEAYAMRLSRAHALADMGLPAQAAQAYEALAGLLSAPGQAALARLSAATLREESEDMETATALYLAAAGAPSVAADALEGALRGAVSEAQLREALEAADRALAETSIVGADRERIAAARAQFQDALDGGTALELVGDRPVPPGWRIEDPAALERARGALHVRSFGQGPLLRAEVDYGGGPITLELDATFSQIEWSAGLQLELLDTLGRAIMTLPVQAIGGGGLVEHDIVPHVLGLGPKWRGRDEPGRLGAGQPVRYTLRCALRPGTEASGCTIQKDGRLVSAWHGAVERLASGRLQIALRTLGESTAACEAVLHGIHATGLSVQDPPTQTDAREQALSTEGVLRAGRFDAGRTLLEALLREPSGRTSVLKGLRRDPDLYLPVLASMDAHRLYPLVHEALASSQAMHPDDCRMDDEVERAIIGLDAYVAWAHTAPASDRATARELLRWRARIRVRGWELAAARADLERALALDRTLPIERVAGGEPRTWILLDLAELEITAGNRARATALISAAKVEGAQPELVADLIAARSTLLEAAGGSLAR